MNARTRTVAVAVAVAAAVVALGGGAVVADASNHASSFASSATQDAPGGFGRFGAQPPGTGGAQGPTPPSGQALPAEASPRPAA